jgi:GntR family transcriptional regulator, transcriptional repressor for pyruvate dehydrogenase complex
LTAIPHDKKSGTGLAHGATATVYEACRKRSDQKRGKDMAVKKTAVLTSSTEEGALFQPLPVKRTFVEIANQIRSSIYSKILKPGDKLPSERELTAQFGVGRISVREALRMLEQAGLILIKQGSGGGAYVRAADTSAVSESVFDLVSRSDISLEDLTEVRLAVEKQILQSAFEKITPDDMELLQESIKELETVIGKKTREDIPVYFELTNFHVIIARATRNPVFEIILKVLMNVTVKVINLQLTNVERLKRHLSFHKAIYNAIKDRDLDRAIKKTEEHMLQVAHQYSDDKRKEKVPRK